MGGCVDRPPREVKKGIQYADRDEAWPPVTRRGCRPDHQTCRARKGSLLPRRMRFCAGQFRERPTMKELRICARLVHSGRGMRCPPAGGPDWLMSPRDSNMVSGRWRAATGKRPAWPPLAGKPFARRVTAVTAARSRSLAGNPSVVCVRSDSGHGGWICSHWRHLPAWAKTRTGTIHGPSLLRSRALGWGDWNARSSPDEGGQGCVGAACRSRSDRGSCRAARRNGAGSGVAGRRRRCSANWDRRHGPCLSMSRI